MPAGKLTLVSKGQQSNRSARNATNIVRKPHRGKKAAAFKVAKSFMQAYHKMQPSKEARIVNVNNLTSGTNIFSVAQLAAITGGTLLNQRLGNGVYISYIQIRGTFNNNSVVKGKQVRMIIIREKNFNNFVTATASDLFIDNNYNPVPPTGQAGTGWYNINRNEYEIVFDKRYSVRPELQNTSIIKENIRVGKEMWYDQDDITDSAPNTGRLIWVICLYDPDSNTNTTVVDVDLQARVFFKDLPKNAQNNFIY